MDLIEYLNTDCGIALSMDTVLLHLLWADDLILVSDSQDGLQKQLDGLFNFCKKSHTIVNSMKTKVMIFGNCNTTNYKFIYNKKELDIVNGYKYLGVLFNSISRYDGNVFKDAYKYIANQGRKAMFKILKDTI